ncbi:MAG: threonine dehydrogenase-like Zn-dependent dehydrogenase [Gammaproteobacteria bacterium]|jgi:threonine dehydrogenase-like Zn-dependent dehydrogenase
MKAAIYKESGKPFVISDVPDPVAGPGEAIIKVCRCGICGSDINLTSGSPFDFPRGIAIGHEYAGEVVALGAGIKHLKLGDRVTAMPIAGCGHCEACSKGFPFHCSQGRSMMGGFAEYTRIDERYTFKIPDMLSFDDGALIEPLACGARAVRHGNVGPGVKVLIVGAGAMGMAALYWSHLLGAENIGVTASSLRREDLARAMGASYFLAAGDDLCERAADALGGPADVVFECAGADSTIAQSINLVKPGGTVVVMGACSHDIKFIPLIAVGKEVRLQFSLAYDLQDFQRTLDQFSAGCTEPRAMINQTISLDALPQKMELMRQPHYECKVMVDPWKR